MEFNAYTFIQNPSSMSQFRKFLNKKVIDIIKSVNKDLSKKREVTHWFYFEHLADLERFERYANDIGFDTKDKPRRNNRGSLLLIVGRTEKINQVSIDFDTIDFSKKAEEFNGTYDGWETCIELE